MSYNLERREYFVADISFVLFLVAQMVLLTVKSEFVQHVVVNALVLVSKFVYTMVWMRKLVSLVSLDYTFEATMWFSVIMICRGTIGMGSFICCAVRWKWRLLGWFRVRLSLLLELKIVNLIVLMLSFWCNTGLRILLDYCCLVISSFLSSMWACMRIRSKSV